MYKMLTQLQKREREIIRLRKCTQMANSYKQQKLQREEDREKARERGSERARE